MSYREKINELRKVVTSDEERKIIKTAEENLGYIAWETEIRSYVGRRLDDDLLKEISDMEFDSLNELCRKNKMSIIIEEDKDKNEILMDISKEYPAGYDETKDVWR